MKRKAAKLPTEETEKESKRLKEEDAQNNAEEEEEEEQMSGEDDQDEAPKAHRKRKKQIYKNLVNQMEFYFGDSNLSKSRWSSFARTSSFSTSCPFFNGNSFSCPFTWNAS